MLLYNSPISGNCYKVRLLLAHLGIPYETRFVDAVDRTLSRDELAGTEPDAPRADARARRRPPAGRVERDPLVLR